MSLESLIALATQVEPDLAVKPLSVIPKDDDVYRGHAVKDGIARFTSVSALEKADASSATGCLRQWWWRYVRGEKEPEDDAKNLGIENHARTAHYLRTGDRTILTGQILRGQHMLPDPIATVRDPSARPDLLVEHPLVGADLTKAILLVGGLPLIGKIDVAHRRGVNKGGSDVERIYDPPGTIEVIDWKFPGKSDRAKKDSDLPKLIQMAGYGTWAFLVVPEAPLVRLSHGVMPVQGQPVKATCLVDRDAIAPAWEHANVVARSIVDAARETDEHKVEANTRVCGPLQGVRKACRYRDKCSAAGTHSLAHWVGMTQSENLISAGALVAPRSNLPIEPFQEVDHAMTMTMLEQIRAQTQGNTAPPNAAMAPTNTSCGGVVGSVTVGLNAAVMGGFNPPTGIQPAYGLPPGITMQPAAAVAVIDPAELARVKAEEEAANHARAEAANRAKLAAMIPPGFVETWQAVLSHGYGQPAVGGALAAAYAAMNGSIEHGQGYAGTGPMGGRVLVSDMAQLQALLGELTAPRTQAAAPVALAAPVPAPVQAPIPAPIPVVTYAQTANPFLSPETPPSIPALAATQPPSADPLAGITADKPKRTRAKKDNPDSAAAPQAAPQSPVAGAPTQAAVEPGAFGLIVVVDASCPGATDFRPIAKFMSDRLAHAFGAKLQVGDVTLLDPRFGDKEGALGYSRFKAAAQAYTVEMFDKGQIPDGLYRLDTGGDDLLAAYASGLAEVCAKRGGLFIRGGL